MLPPMNWISWVTFGIAVVGATLGIFNAYWAVRRDSVRLRVRFVSLLLPASGTWTVGIEVINTGSVAVTVNEVAVTGGGLGRKKRGIITEDFFRSTPLPNRLEPRTAMTIAAQPGFRDEVRRMRASHCSARTACGVTVKARIRYG